MTRCLHLFALVLLPLSSRAACSLCNDENAEIKADNSLSVPGFPWVQTCGDILPFLSSLDVDSKECSRLRSLSTLCGCPVQQQSCELCSSQDSQLDGAKEIPIFAELFGGIIPTCGLFRAYLHSIEETDGLCSISKSFVADYCECASSEESDSISSAVDNNSLHPEEQRGSCSLCQEDSTDFEFDKELSLEGFPFRTCGELHNTLEFLLTEENEQCSQVRSLFAAYCGCSSTDTPPAGEICSLCTDGSTAPFQNKEFDAFGKVAGVVPTCGLLEASIHANNRKGDDVCTVLQLSSSKCGCSPLEEHCVLCDQPFPEEHKNKTLNFVHSEYSSPEVSGLVVTCELFEASQYQIPAAKSTCGLLQTRAFLCGCNNGIYDYGMAANSRWKQVLLLWAGRTSGCFSFVCSISVIIFILSSKRRYSQVYNQIIGAMFVFDAVTGFVWIVGPAFIPEELFGDPSGFYGSYGNETTCRISGFLVQLGFTSMYYTVSLLIYYHLVIVYGWRTRSLKKVVPLLHAIPVITGLSLSIIGWWHYYGAPFGCYLASFPYKSHWKYFTFLCLMPASLSLILIMLLSTHIIIHVHRQTRMAERWTYAWRNNASVPQQTDFSLQRQAMPRRMAHEASTESLSISSSGPPPEAPQHFQPSRKRTLSLENQVRSQALAYVLAFWITWPILIAAFLMAKWKFYPFGVLVMFVGPLQGLNNFLVYFRPYIERGIRKKYSDRISARAQNHNDGSDGDDSTNASTKTWRMITCCYASCARPSLIDRIPWSSNQSDVSGIDGSDAEDPNVAIAHGGEQGEADE